MNVKAADELVTVGERGRIIAETARQAGMDPSAIHELTDSDEAITFLLDHLGADDIVLIKGSRGMNMDRIVTALEVRS
jgi:UDP-N-acetylmuramoyl-tripeptide--D-alanyl-D-alanine ligase